MNKLLCDAYNFAELKSLKKKLECIFDSKNNPKLKFGTISSVTSSITGKDERRGFKCNFLVFLYFL